MPGSTPRNLVWTGAAGDGNFSNPANWEDTATATAALTAPTSIDFVSFQGSTSGTVGGTGTAETLTIGGLMIAWTFDGSITLSGQATAFTPVGVVVFTPTYFSGATINDSAASVQINGSGATTVLTAENASTVTAAATFIGNANDASGALVVTGVNTGWHDIYNAAIFGSGVMLVGQAGPSGMQPGSQGSLTVTDHAVVTEDSSAVLGVNAGSTGTATVSDYGIWNTGTIFYVGESGDGSLTIETGGTVAGTSGATALIGQNAGSQGTVTVSSTGVWNDGSTLYVGQSGSGLLSIGGTVTNTGNAAIGANNGGTGTVTVVSGGVWNAGSILTVGQLGSGSLSVGGTVTNTGNAVIGANKGGTGTVTVVSGGVWTIGSVLTVAQSTGSTGDLDIEAGGTVSLTDAAGSANPVVIIGQGPATTSPAVPAAMGSVTVEGAGAKLIANDPIQLGGSLGGDASLTIDQGGSVAAATADSGVEYGLALANRSGVAATLTVGDADPTTTARSQLSVAGVVIIGRGGNATANIDYGGTLLITDAAANGSGLTIGAGRKAGPNGPTYVGGSGTVVVTGGTIDVASAQSGLNVGGYGADGTLDVNSGGVVLAGTVLSVGGATEPTGTSFGAGTIFNGTGTLNIGQYGTVKITDATLPGTADVIIGNAGGALATTPAPAPLSSGTVTVSGSGALLDTNGGELVVGDFTQGGLTISKGGTVNAGTVDIGVTANGPGAIDVEGDGYSSLLAATGALNVGLAGQGVLTVSTGGTVAVGGTVTIGASGTVVGAGGVIDPPTFYYNYGETYGPLTVQATAGIVNTGTFVAAAGQLELNGAVTGTGVLQVAGGGVLQLDQGVAATQSVALSGTGATLAIKDPTGFASTIEGYTAGDTVTLYGIAPDDTPTYSQSGGNTTLDYGGGIALTFAGTHATGSINVQADTTPAPPPPMPCFLMGTHIATERGEVAVEALRVGDRVVVAGGGARPVRWIGARSLEPARHAQPDMVLPIRVRRDAFAPGRPHRDLFLSPDHAVFVDGVLIAIRQLVNGGSIAPVARQRVTYFHVELDRHDVLFAEGLPAESYLDTGNRTAFANGGGAVALHPDFAGAGRRAAASCAKLAVAADAVEPIWRRLAARGAAMGRPPALLARTEDAALTLRAGGRALKPAAIVGQCFVFVLPAGTDAVRIASRAVVPSALRPWLDDRRRLGVAIGRIGLRARADRTEMPVDHPALVDGWHDVERDGVRQWRWTDGDALLPLPAGTTMVEISLALRTHYPVTRPAVAMDPDGTARDRGTARPAARAAG